MASFLTYLVAGGSKQWEELIEPTPSPIGEFTRETRTVTRNFRVPIEQVGDLTNECLPYGTFPGKHPMLTYLYVSSVRFQPMPGELLNQVGGHSEPANYQVSITYAPLDIGEAGSGDINSSDPVDYLVGNISYTTEAISLPKYTLKWSQGDEVIKDTGSGDEMHASIMIPRTQFSVILPRRTSIPWVAMRNCRGRVNSANFFGAPPETVLYGGMMVAYRFSSNGQRQFDIEHHFDERAIPYDGNIYGWNHLWDSRPSKLRFDKPYRGTSTDKKFLYESASFGQLITLS